LIRLKRLYANDFKQLKQVDLAFPDAGRILVRGKNEAGKSTLFEAVFFALFGRALITEAGSHGLGDLVGYGHEVCRVELDVQIRDSLYMIERDIKASQKRDKTTGAEKIEGKQEASLTIVREEGEERVEGITNVNTRLERELGFDAETLLNTCFVEQKKLDKLEVTARKEREHALAKLLNLDALVALEQDLEVTRDDREHLARLEMRWKLAQAQADLPPVEAELEQVERALNLAELKKQLVEASETTRTINSLKAELEQARPRAQEAAMRAERAQVLRDAVNDIKNATTALDTNLQQREQLERERAAAVESERQDRENLPRLEHQIQELVTQTERAKHLARVDTIRVSAERESVEWQAKLQQARDASTRAEEIAAQVQVENARRDELQARLRDFQLGAALDEWVQATSAAATGAAPESLDAKRLARRQLETRARRDLIASIVILLVGISISFSAFFILSQRSGLLFALSVGGLVLVLTIVLVAFLIVRTFRDYQALTEAAQQLGQLEKQDEAASLVRRATQARIDQANATFAALGVPAPRDQAFAQARRVELAGKLAEKSQDETAKELHDVQVNLGVLEQERRSKLDAVQAVQTDKITSNIKECEEKTSHAKELMTTYGPVAGGKPVTELERMRDRARDLFDLTQKRLQDSSRAAQFDQRGRTLDAGLTHVRESMARVAQAIEIPASSFDGDLTIESLRAYGKKVQEEYQRVGGSQANEDAKQANAAVATKEGELAAHTRGLNNLWQAASALALKLKVDNVPAALPDSDALEQWASQLDAPDAGERESYERRSKKLLQERGRLRGIMQDLDAKLNTGGEFLDEPQTRTEFNQFERETRVRKRAVAIAETARRRVMQKVLPATMDYMRRLLPQLTRERYHDAELDPDSYKIKVWDERGQSWKEKNIFSGGTKDQFSLALRLAFALATLPQERNTAPGFIFLDEPLGAFDDERADALIDLLTQGEVAHAFDQIFLISHVRVNPEHFSHSITLENGRVVEMNLPKTDSPEN
jgi:exonuclease SbcC